MAIGALPAPANGQFDRALMQEWARAIHEDSPSGASVDGIFYHSGYNGGRALVVWSAEQKIGALEQPGVDCRSITQACWQD